MELNSQSMLKLVRRSEYAVATPVATLFEYLLAIEEKAAYGNNYIVT